ADFSKIVALSRPNGEVITLDRIAEVRDTFDENALFSRFNGHRCVSVMVQKTSEEDTLAIDRVVRDYITKKQATLPPGVYLEPWGGSTDVLQSRLNLLIRNGAIGIVIVFALLWLFLDIRLSFWAGMGLPISITGALAIMWVIGTTLNMVTLFGLIMVIGIIVDDAIVVGEAIYVARRNGASPLQAAVEGVMEVGMPVIAAVTTTVIAFIPLMFVGGIMGKFISQLPVVVISCLIISLVECLILLPAHLNHLPDPHRSFKARNILARFGHAFHTHINAALVYSVKHLYQPVLLRALQWRYITLSMAIAMMIIMGGLVGGGMVRFMLFPKLDGDIILADVEFPSGTPRKITEEAVAKLEEAIKTVGNRFPTKSGEPLLKNIYALVGSGIDPRAGNKGSHVGGMRVEIVSAEDRSISSIDLIAAWEKEVGAIPGSTSLAIKGAQMGPPGSAIEIRLRGRSLEKMLEAAEKLKNKLGTYDAVYQIQHDFRPGQNEFRLRLKPEAHTLGLSVADLGTQLFAGYFGRESVRIQRGRDDVRVRVRYPLGERRSLDDFERIRIRTPRGDEVPLRSVAAIEYGPGVSVIKRSDGMRQITISAEVLAHGNANEITTDIESEFISRLREQYP
ncbi:MAG: efflux RND transporter permease subunit, partial [Candidatus Hydrogenedentes bacterium]|nr:efflux RND transporter permease subunit [Candidatus Hydrogenedentota bacterium]